MEFTRVMCLMTLGVCAISLQGCGAAEKESPEDLKIRKAAEHAAALEKGDVMAIREEFGKSGGCVALYATVPTTGESSPPLETIQKAVTGKVLASAPCGKDFYSDECKEAMVFEITDQILFYAESRDPFKTWVASNEFGRGSSYGTMDINSMLKVPARGAVDFLQEVTQGHGYKADGMPEMGDYLKYKLAAALVGTIDGQCRYYRTARKLQSDLLV